MSAAQLPEPGSPEWEGLIKARKRELDLETIAEYRQPSLLDEFFYLEKAEKELAAAKDMERYARSALANGIALARGITPGTIVREEQKRFNKKTVTVRYKVHDWELFSRTILSLRGHLIRKDGSLGELRNIGSGWEIERGE